ncbi:MAG: M28 family peptidase [Candidatus Marinimicrobia bacterium]|nr:M28 family peptidase [Candidatus Neomarinimicrobiota bacterium]MCF7851169.1 M28 family peptidase [Candidatus Neomarinimicrobiota bacterium]MCF7904247.1 M28 family peptidase [Candidatus Neomarinimicrobiota bacterium]
MLNQLINDVERLVEPGSRKVGSPGHVIAKNYLIERMQQTGLQPYWEKSFQRSYQKNNQEFTNLAGLLPGKDTGLAPLLLAAHYDTCGDQPGADDNAAAIAIWFAVIEQLKGVALDRSLLFLFPDAEEPPNFLSASMGSTNFYLNQRLGDIHAGLVLDLVGHDIPIDGMEDILFVIGAESHPAMAQVVAEVNPPPGLRNLATLNRYVGDLSDHHILREQGKPYLFFTCGRWNHYHQETDLPENLNYSKMARIATYLIPLVQRVSAAELYQFSEDFDPVEMELKLIHRAVGPYLEKEGIPMQDRDDIQRYVFQLVNQHKL